MEIIKFIISDGALLEDGDSSSDNDLSDGL